MPLSPSADSPTEDVAVAASLGDADALAALYDRFAPVVIRFVASRTSDRMLAEEIAANTWVSVARGIRGYQSGRRGFEPWLIGVTKNEVRTYFRRVTKPREVLTGDMLALDRSTDASLSPEHAYESREVAEHLAAELATLPRRQRECVQHRFYLGLSLVETGHVMGLEANAVKQLQYRALQALRRRLGPQTMAALASATGAVAAPTPPVAPRGLPPKRTLQGGMT